MASEPRDWFDEPEDPQNDHRNPPESAAIARDFELGHSGQSLYSNTGTMKEYPASLYTYENSVEVTQKIKDEIICRMAEGELLSRICRDLHMPSFAHVRSYLRRGGANYDPIFEREMNNARVEGAFAMADQIIDIADDSENDFITQTMRGGRVKVIRNREMVERARLRIETRRFLMSKYLKAVFGNQTSTGSADGELIDPDPGV